MKKGILILMIGSFALLSTIDAQGKKEKQGKQGDCPQGKQNSECVMMDLPDLTEAQKSDFKAIKLKFEEQALPLKNRLNEINARQTTLLSTENEVSKELTKLISEEAEVKQQFDMLKASNVMEIKSKLTPEQKVIFNSHLTKQRNHNREMGMHNQGHMNGQDCRQNGAPSNTKVTPEVTTK